MGGREPKTSRNCASRRQALRMLVGQDRPAPVRDRQRSGGAQGQLRSRRSSRGEVLGRRVLERFANRGELLVERAGSHESAASVDDAEREGAVQLQAAGVARQDVGVQFRTHHALRGHDVIAEAQRDGAARVRADQVEALCEKRRAVVRVDEHRHDAVAVARRHQDDVGPSPAADPRSLAVEDHVAVRCVRRAKDRRVRSVPRQRDARAALTATEGGEPRIAEAWCVARRDGSDRVPMLQPNERRGQAPRGERFDDRCRRRRIEVRPAGVDGPCDAVEPLARQEIEMGDRQQVRGVRRQRRGEQDVLRDLPGPLHDRLHGATVATARCPRQMPVKTGGLARWAVRVGRDPDR